MRQRVLQIFLYVVLAIGTTFLAYAISSIAKTEYSISQIMGEMTIDSPTKRNILDAQTTRQEDFDKTDFDVRTQVDSHIFSDRRLHQEITPTDGHFIFNEILSADGSKIAYAELSDCAGRTHFYKNLSNPQKCQWDYSIKVIYRESGAIVNVYSQNGDERSLAGVALIYQPYAWTKGNNNLILTWSNIGLGGRDDAPAEYSLIDLSNNKIEGLGDGTVFSRDFGTATYTTGGDMTSICDEETQAAPTSIKITDLTTGESKTLIGEKGTLYSIDSYNRDTDALTYRFRKPKNAKDCNWPSSKDSKKTIATVF